jgi:hypothetical protein
MFDKETESHPQSYAAVVFNPVALPLIPNHHSMDIQSVVCARKMPEWTTLKMNIIIERTGEILL